LCHTEVGLYLLCIELIFECVSTDAAVQLLIGDTIIFSCVILDGISHMSCSRVKNRQSLSYIATTHSRWFCPQQHSGQTYARSRQWVICTHERTSWPQMHRLIYLST